jgi:hypothetical protein
VLFAGLTHRLQPLDTRINGPIKAQARADWKADRLADPKGVPKHADGLRHLMHGLTQVKADTVRLSFRELTEPRQPECPSL